MLRRAAIVSAFAASLAMPLAGCGIRGPLYMPRVPPPPTAPSVPDPGLGNPGTATPAPPSAPATPAPTGTSGDASAPNTR